MKLKEKIHTRHQSRPYTTTEKDKGMEYQILFFIYVY